MSNLTNESWLTSGNIITGVIAVDTIWLAGLTWYTTTRIGELSDRISKLEEENKSQKKKISDMKGQLATNKSIVATLENHDERIDTRADKKELLVTQEKLNQILIALDDDEDSSYRRSSKKTKSLFKNKPSKYSTQNTKRSSTKKHFVNFKSSSSETSDDSYQSESSSNKSMSETDMNELYETLDFDTKQKQKQNSKSKKSEKKRKNKLK